MDKWFKNFPFFGWIVIFVTSLGACVTGYHIEQHRYSEKNLVELIQKDFESREKQAQRDYASGVFEKFAAGRMPDTLDGKYYLFICKDGEVKRWSSSNVDLPASAVLYPDSLLKGRMHHFSRGYFYIKSWPLPADTGSVTSYAYTLIPVLYDYRIENEYFESHFVTPTSIPLSRILSILPEQGPYTIYDQRQQPAFCLDFNTPPKSVYEAGIMVWILALIAAFGLCAWVNETCCTISRGRKEYLTGWFLLLFFILILQVILRFFPVPVGFANSRIFSPQLFSTGKEVKSLGELIIYIGFSTWLLIYLIKYIPSERLRHLFKSKVSTQLVRIIVSVFLLYILVRYCCGYIYKLVIDSKISFEAGDFTYITAYTFVGILAIALITLNLLFILVLFNRFICGIFSTVFKYFFLVITVASLAVIVPAGLPFSMVLLFAVAGMALIDILGLPFPDNVKRGLVFSSSSYIWFAVLCSWITLEIFYLNYTKERELRKVFAQKQYNDNQILIYYQFDEIAEKIDDDPDIRRFIKNGPQLPDARMEQYIYYNYLTDYVSKYTVALFFYNKNRKSADSLSTRMLQLADSAAGKPLYYGVVNLASESNAPAYWGICSITDDMLDTLGYVAVFAQLDNRPKMAKQRTFFQKKYNPTDQQYFDKYAYGIYHDQRLYDQGGDAVFPFRSNEQLTKDFVFKERLRSSVLMYRISDTEYIQVIYKRNIITGLVSLFSYVLAILLLMSAAAFLLRYVLFHPLTVRLFFRMANPTIRSKVNLTILLTVFASLFVVGSITVSVLNIRYNENQRKNLRNLVYFFSQNIKEFTKDDAFYLDTVSGAAYSGYADLNYRLNNLAQEQDAEVNIYNSHGRLAATSQTGLLKEGILSHYMSPAVLAVMESGLQSEMIVKEKIGKLKYQSIYTTLRDKDGKIIAYINLPYYASYTAFQDEISNVLVTLINVYTLVFFLSGISAVLISSSIIRSFRLLIAQFRNIQLTRNEAIKWPYKDEISLLVKEYNAMMQKVEDMAKKLARTEREEAWREIAKQVAHEIKNPLTPMKLSIQYLQNAVRSDRDDVKDLTMRVSETLIEQIENLNLIATEFSNFAKMPEAFPEEINLSDALRSIVALFENNNQKGIIRLDDSLPSACIYIDKSYFIRIFNNIISNAIQAVPPDREPLIEIKYEQVERNVVISVKDNGKGISGQMKENLFVPYFTTKTSGTGLGLYMTKKMVEHANGSIGFETESGLGTIFYISFPLAERY